MKEQSFTSNPFFEKTAAEKQNEQWESTERSFNELKNFCRFLSTHFKDYPLPAKHGNQSKISFDLPGNRSISLEKYESGTYVLKENITSADGTENQLSYEVSVSDSQDGSLYYTVTPPKSISLRTKFQFNRMKQTFINAYDWESLYGHAVFRESKDGLHVSSDQQEHWDKQWSKFQMELSYNTKFGNFLNRLDTNDSASWESRKWAYDFMRGGIKVPDAQAFLKETQDYWKMAVGGDIPKKLIPQTESSERPADQVYSYDDVKKFFLFFTHRLKEVTRTLDKHFFPDNGPYRSPARNSGMI